jgi:argininosuccinate lyase
VSPHLTPEIRTVLDVRGAIASRDRHGGTAPERVGEQLEVLRLEVAAQRSWAAAAPA